jgi:CubicO group peptidase (beta-lactamase class C family)
VPDLQEKRPHFDVERTDSVRLNERDRRTAEGIAAPEFHKVREAFERNFVERGEQGAACCVYYRGQAVVDLWGGCCSKTGAGWQKNTLALVFSATKGMAAAAMAVAHSRGLFDLNAPVAEYWPQFAQNGKAKITIRQLLAHQAGLISIDARLDARTLADHDRMAEILAREPPAWQPGHNHGYHTLTLGWYQNELIRRIDPQRRTLGTFFQDEIARPLGVNFFIGLPADIAEERLAVTDGFDRRALVWHWDTLPLGFVLAAIWPQSLAAKSVRQLRLRNPAELGGPLYRGLEIPSANGIGEARALAKVYGVLAGDGHELGISDRTRRELIAPAMTPADGAYDLVLRMDTRYGFGFSRPSQDMRFGADASAFGCPGAGGCFGMADPTNQLGFAYVTSKMGFHLFDDPREKAVRDACYACLAEFRETKRVA